MSQTPTLLAAGRPAAEAAPKRAWPRWMREPLVHFVVLGGLLFAVDHWIVARTDDPRVIVVGSAVDDEARRVFRATHGRDPNADELAALRRVWLDNEVLYREGLALEVDKGDEAIRDRVIFKALSVVDASTKLPPVDDATLRRWFDAHRAKYDDPPRFDFEEAVLEEPRTEAAVRAFVARLNDGTPGDTNAGLRVFKGRPRENLVQSYGETFAHALESAPPGRWQAERGDDGWRAVRVVAVAHARPAQYEAIRDVVRQDWADATLAEQRSAAVASLAKKYDVRYGDGAR